MGRAYALSGPGSDAVSIKLDQPVAGAWMVAAWIRIDQYPNDGKTGFTSTNPAVIAKLGGEVEALLRLDGDRLMVSTNAAGDWRSVRSAESIPLNKWVLVAGAWAEGELAVYINALQCGSRALPDADASFDSLTIGRDQDRVFVGGVDEVRIIEGITNENILREVMQSRGREPDKAPAIQVSEPWVLPYPCLRVKEDALHPLVEGVGTRACVVPWLNDGKVQMIVGDIPGFFGSRVTLHTQVGVDDRGLPVLSPGKPLALHGMGFRPVPRKDGLFDLMAYSKGSPFSGGTSLIYFRNTGTKGEPVFEAPSRVQVGDSTLVRGLGMAPGGWSLHDFDGDGVLDLLISGGSGMTSAYYPGGVSFWNGEDYPNSGPGRGYDIMGNWLGGRSTTALFWAHGRRTENGTPAFDTPKPVYLGGGDFQVQWRFYSPIIAPDVLTSNGQQHIVLSGDMDKIVALPFTLLDGELRCQPAKPLLRDSATLKEAYWVDSVDCVDVTGDGVQDVVVTGNPGRLVVLRGTEVGAFEEVGSLMMKGGELEVDTLVTPARGLWDEDKYPDLICGDSSGYLTYWPGTEDTLVYGEPVFMRNTQGEVIHHQAGPAGSIQGPNEGRWGYLQPTLGDWDGDGRDDLIVNDILAEISLYRRTSDPGVVEKSEFTLEGEPLPAAWRARPAVLSGSYGYAGDDRAVLLYLDDDGDASLGIPEQSGSTKIIRSDKLYYNDGDPVRLSGVRGHWGRAKLSIADWDGDGTWDIVWGHNAGVHRYIWKKNPPRGATPCWLRNIGTNTEPVFERLRIIKTADGELLDFKVHNASVWPTDLNNDDQLDLIIGAEDGKVYYFYHDELATTGTGSVDGQ